MLRMNYIRRNISSAGTMSSAGTTIDTSRILSVGRYQQKPLLTSIIPNNPPLNLNLTWLTSSFQIDLWILRTRGLKSSHLQQNISNQQQHLYQQQQVTIFKDQDSSSNSYESAATGTSNNKNRFDNPLPRSYSLLG